MKSFSGKQIFLLFRKSNSGKSFIYINDEGMFLINEDTYNFCKEGKIASLGFIKNSKPLETEGRDPLFTWSPAAEKMDFSEKVTIAEQIEISELRIQLKKVTKELEVA